MPDTINFIQAEVSDLTWYKKMKAIVYHKYGTPDVLQLKETDNPVPDDNEVLIKVYAASINDWDWGLLHGDLINRLLNGLRKPKRKNNRE